MKPENESCGQLDVKSLAKDEDLIRQVKKSREDRRGGRMYNEEQGLAYFRKQVDAFDKETGSR